MHDEDFDIDAGEAAEQPVDELAELAAEDRHIMLDWMRGVFANLRATMQHQRTPGDMLRTFDIACLALGFSEICGAEDAAALSRRHGISPRNRQTVNGQLKEFMQQLRLPPLPQQRSEEAAANMRAARLRQVKGENQCQTN